MIRTGMSGRFRGLLAFAVASAGVAVAQPPPPLQPLPPPPVPPQNPITEQKRVLGKILFWEEQLSSDSTVSCGTCHAPANAGADRRIGRNPGADNVFNTPDDKLGSPGVRLMDANEDYISDPTFGTNVQVTRRTAQHVVNSAYSNNAMFWDGRALGTFTNPETGTVSIPGGGALESQSIVPILSSVEMGNQSRTWNDVRAKLAAARPLANARRIPADMANAIADGKSYGDLFADAFGSPEITAERIAFAIATYERTLIPNQAPIDAFIAGNNGALTAAQQRGLGTFGAGGRCAVCHAGSVFSNQTFRVIGLRPPAEDTGRQEVTLNPGDRGRFKVPSLRNVGLKTRFMHNGQLTTLTDVVNFYANPQLGFPDNRDPVMPAINIPPGGARADLVDFLSNALTDPRVRNEQFPFDRPLLRSEAIGACRGDLDGNHITDLTDLSAMLAHFGTGENAAYFEGDVNGDGAVDLTDLSILLSGFGQPCPA